MAYKDTNGRVEYAVFGAAGPDILFVHGQPGGFPPDVARAGDGLPAKGLDKKIARGFHVPSGEGEMGDGHGCFKRRIGNVGVSEHRRGIQQGAV